MKHKFALSIPLAILLTFVAIIYQRGTGPTYPKKVWLEVSGTKVKVPFLRSFGGEENAPVEIPLLDPEMSATLHYKRYPTNDEWAAVPFEKTKNSLKAFLPNQPPAGKIQYFVNINKSNQLVQRVGSLAQPIFIRFKGNVPSSILIPHIFFMFFAMLLSTLAAIEAYFKTQSFQKIGYLTLGSLVFGGLFLGPLVQKYAFGVYWAGFPFDWDLTDNKLLISVLAWGLAVSLNLKKSVLRPIPYMVAGLVLIGMYSIPHSTMGSQYNYELQKVETDK